MHIANAKGAQQAICVLRQHVHRIGTRGRVTASVPAGVEREYAVVTREFWQLRAPHRAIARQRMTEHEPWARLVRDIAMQFVVEPYVPHILSHVIPPPATLDRARLDSAQFVDSTDTNTGASSIRYG